MGRPQRLQIEGGCYHVFNRGNRRERIFRSEADYAAFEERMFEAMRWSGVRLFNWSQMPNHFHLNLETPDGNIAEFMQRLLTRFSKYFNRTYRLVGHLFQSRYGARLIDQENHFLEIIRYVELNPYRLKKGTLAELGQWKWSSLRYYLRPETDWPEGCQAAFHQVLERFGKDPVSARKHLAAFLADGLKDGRWEDFYQVKDHRFVGDSRFLEQMKQHNQEPARLLARVPLQKMNLTDLMSRVEELSGISPAALRAPGKTRLLSRWRQVFMYVARRFYRVPLVRLATCLGRNESTTSLMWTRHRAEVDQWPETHQFIQSLQRSQNLPAAEMQNANTDT